jgi:trans-AT polyketide synthase/acyltransferase/oxidoreductase domain-containing protein
MGLTPAVVRYAASGLRTDASGASSAQEPRLRQDLPAEVAGRFMAPAPRRCSAPSCRRAAHRAEAELAARVPVAEDITVEADSGGHTDNQPLTALFPVILALRDELCAKHGYTRPIRVGAAGGSARRSAVAAAFALGAAYVLTGSVNQAPSSRASPSRGNACSPRPTSPT